MGGVGGPCGENYEQGLRQSSPVAWGACCRTRGRQVGVAPATVCVQESQVEALTPGQGFLPYLTTVRASSLLSYLFLHCCRWDHRDVLVSFHKPQGHLLYLELTWMGFCGIQSSLSFCQCSFVVGIILRNPPEQQTGVS